MGLNLTSDTSVEPCDDGYFASDKRFPGCWGFGMTEQEALDELCDCLAGWHYIKRTHGDDDLPPSDLTFSGGEQPNGSTVTFASAASPATGWLLCNFAAPVATSGARLTTTSGYHDTQDWSR